MHRTALLVLAAAAVLFAADVEVGDSSTQPQGFPFGC
jgi:hypothetical protein